MNASGSDERKFLHDIAGPLSNATLLISTLVRQAEKHPNTDAMIKEGIVELGEIMGELRILLDKRRDLLISRGK